MAESRSKFLLKNLVKGLLWFGFLLLLYILLKDKIDIHPESWVGKVSDKPVIVFSIFLASEIIIGIIPPELFMGWAAAPGDLPLYVFYVSLLSIISYGAGVFGYFVGRFLNRTILFRYTRKKFFKQVETFFRTYGGFLIFVAAVTPVPYSAVCVLVGSVKYSFRLFLLLSLSRFLRFGVYATILWQVGEVPI